MRTPVTLITGVDAESMAAAMVTCQFDLPNAVAVRHHIDVEAEVLHRVVSDLSGVIEREQIDLAHACVSCAIREDVVPTLDRLAGMRRWSHIVAHLPIGAEAEQVCGVLAWDSRLARRLRIASVVTALPGRDLVDTLLGDSLLADRGVQTSPDDRRGTGEIACAMVEYADAVVLVDAEEHREPGLALVRTLARPEAYIAPGVDVLDTARLGGRLHQHGAADAWSAHVRSGALPPPASPDIWQLDLRSDRPFHAERMLDGLDAIGSGPHRSRGCFWLPSRPGQALEWDGSGGQLSIGNGEPWGRRSPFTRLVLTGVGTPPLDLMVAFDRLLARPGEPAATGYEDGFEPWLGPIEGVA
ncbi:GTP-binding protein [Nocardioides sp. R-C-SC26]|uniref:CobW family GTP-binding protein n=1 Tax=Nocardioides sp. R-C-SC26 TaxID=2870414 RepID=UPI001E4E4F85|nr:GTP-binding protein [Nocardioides sp. R-C-SC26]